MKEIVSGGEWVCEVNSFHSQCFTWNKVEFYDFQKGQCSVWITFEFRLNFAWIPLESSLNSVRIPFEFRLNSVLHEIPCNNFDQEKSITKHPRNDHFDSICASHYFCHHLIAWILCYWSILYLLSINITNTICVNRICV